MKLCMQASELSTTGKKVLVFTLLTMSMLSMSVTASAGKKHTASLDVEAEGVVLSNADLAGFVVGVEVVAKTADNAIEQNAVIMKAINETLDDYDIDEKYRNTQHFSLNPEYIYHNNSSTPPTLKGYRVSHQVAVEQLAIEELGSVIDELSKQNATQISSISFASSDREEHLKSARQLAIKNAIKKAEQMADAADVDLEKIIHISEVSSASSHGNNYQLKATRSAFDSASTQLSSGELAHRVMVALRYAIDD